MGILALSLGYISGGAAMYTQMERYTSARELSENFTKKDEYTIRIDKKMFEKERTSVYRGYIANFDTFANFDREKNTGIFSSLGGGNRAVSVFIEVPSNLTVENNDLLKVSGKIEKNIEFPLTGYSRYSFYQGGFGSIYAPSFERIKISETSTIDTFRGWWISIFQDYFPRDVAGVLLGMTIGSIDILSREAKNAFIDSGISHILVVSGSNIAFLILIITFFLKYLSLHKHIRLGIILFFLLFYGTLVGWEISVVRATIMGLLSYGIVEYGSSGSSRAALALAGLVLTFWSPLAPLYDAGFGLSFAATLGILIFHAPIEKWAKGYKIPRPLVSLLSVSIGAMLGSLPVLLYHFEKIPLSSLLTNLLIGWFLGWILFCAVFFVGIASVSFYGALIFGVSLYIPTKLILILSAFFQYGYTVNIPPIFGIPLCLFLLGIYFYLFIEGEYKKSS